ncbi:uncharacterized protein LOC113491822 [Trichoplusia ni]|uniref:Uncharacterized protein LOC113491822 n=1 Tax=Trichoplusia ni TaxID=7111 RepID=A0A7E5V958_TRINI|nr:uncharacterized protein LOC113491822 [Trichoplusia ni]
MANNFVIEPYKQDGDISCFLERIEEYFESNDTIDEKKKCSILLISLQEDVYRIIKNMCHPKVPKELSYKELQEKLKLRFEKRVSFFRKRIEFDRMFQQEGEKVAEWYSRAVHQVARGRQAKPSNSKQSTHKQAKKPEKETGERLKCIHCGKPNHNFSKCKYKSYKCKNCEKTGHLAVVCKSKAQTHSVDTKEEEVSNNSIDIFTIQQNVAYVNYVSPISIQGYIENKQVQMELDTGAAISCLPERIYLSKFSHIKLQHSNIELKTYNGQILKPVGEINCKIKLNDSEVKCKIMVVKNGCKILFGRDLIQKFKLDISKLLSVNCVQSTEEKLQSILKEYDTLFKNELGIIKGEEVTLELIDKDVKPIFHKPKPRKRETLKTKLRPNSPD